jgi:hypothetical protein
MPNLIKYNVSAETLALKKGNFWIGTGDVPKGPTSTTGYWNGITPPDGGYTIYLNKASNGPSIYTPSNDAQLIDNTNKIAGTSYTTVNECFNYYAGQSDKMVFNKNYSSLITNGLVFNVDASFTPSYPRNGTTWYDISSGGNNGTLVNDPTFSSSGGGSFVFDGTDDEVNTSYGPTLGDFTICIWFKDNASATYGRLVDKSYTGGFWLGRNASTPNSWGGGIKETSDPYGIFLTLTDGQWNYLTSIRSGSTHILYGNGITNTTSNTVTSSSLDSTTISIGAWSGPETSQRFKGSIGKVQVYNRALTSAEVLQNYYQGSIVTSNLLVVLDASNLVSYDGTGTTWRDLTSNGSNGTLYNGPTFSSDGGGSIIFDGSDDYSDISIPSITSYGTITICAFIKWLSFGDDMFFGMTTYDVWTYANTLGFNNGAGNVVGINSSTVNGLGLLGNWKHYTFVMNSSGLLSNNKIYINGVSVGSLSAVVGGDGNAPGFATNLRLCGWNNNGGYRGNLQYGNFQVYNRELTVGEINQNFNAQRDRFGI